MDQTYVLTVTSHDMPAILIALREAVSTRRSKGTDIVTAQVMERVRADLVRQRDAQHLVSDAEYRAE